MKLLSEADFHMDVAFQLIFMSANVIVYQIVKQKYI